MVTRRQFLRAAKATAMVGGPLALDACAAGTNADSYEAAARRTCRLADGPTGDRLLVRRELVRCAILPP